MLPRFLLQLLAMSTLVAAFSRVGSIQQASSRKSWILLSARLDETRLTTALATKALRTAAPILVLLGGALSAPIDAQAISGGGKDFAGAKISGQDFSGQDFSGRDFSGCFGQQTNFKKSIFKGTRFYKASLKEADFTGADLSGASLEDAKLDGATFADAIVSGSYFTGTATALGNIKNSDWTDTLLRPDVQRKLCDIASGSNPKTGVDTRESLLCE